LLLIRVVVHRNHELTLYQFVGQGDDIIQKHLTIHIVLGGQALSYLLRREALHKVLPDDPTELIQSEVAPLIQVEHHPLTIELASGDLFLRSNPPFRPDHAPPPVSSRRGISRSRASR